MTIGLSVVIVQTAYYSILQIYLLVASSFIFFFFLSIFLFLFHLLLTIADLINNFLYVLVCVYLFLIHVHHLLGGNHLLLLFQLLLLNGTSVLFFCHLVLLLVIFRCILYEMCVFTNIHWNVARSIRHSISGWWDILSFVAIVKWYALNTNRKCSKIGAQN